MDTIKFADGSVYACSFLATAPMYGKLYVTLTGVTYAEAAAIFSNPNKTREILYGNHVLRGYTQCDVVINEGTGYKAQLSFPTAQSNEEVFIGG